MKNIIFIVPGLFNYGGIARVTINLANTLAETNKYNLTLLSLYNEHNGHAFFDISPKVKIQILPIQNFKLRRDFLRAAFELKKLYSSTFEGTFVIDDVGHNIPAWIGLKHCKKAKFISWSHMNFFNGSKYGFSGVGKRLATKKFDYLIALTKEDLNYYNKILGAKNVIQIYNLRDKNTIKENYKSNEKKIISCGRLNQIKGFDLLIEVAHIVFKNVKDWKWDIYGDGPEKENLQAKIEKYGLTGKVNLMGYHSDILSLYKDYSFNVFTSRGEGCPMAMIEAQSAGLPIVSFDFKCGPKDLITDGKNGFIIENWDIEKMASSILCLIKDNEMRCEFARNADMNLKELEPSYVIEKWKSIL